MSNNINKKENALALNFLPITKNSFKITIWKRLYNLTEIQNYNKIKKYKLPNEKGDYIDFWVSFNEFEHSEKDFISSYTNIKLTKFFLYTLIKDKLNKNDLINDDLNKFTPYRIYIKTEKTNYGYRTIWMEPYFLKSKRRFGYLIDYFFKKNPEVPFNKEIQKLSFSLDYNFRTNVNFHIDKYRQIKKFIENNLIIFSDLQSDLKIENTFYNLEYEQLNSRMYIFNENKEYNSQFQGIKKYYPYKVINNQIKYIFIFHRDHKDYVNNLIKALNGKLFRTFPGLKMFNLHPLSKDNIKGINIEFFNEDLKSKIDKIDQNSIIIAVLPAKEEKFYYTLKNICLTNDIPLQTVHIETIINQNKFKWSTSGIALQIFTKLGGIPWLVKAKNSNCLIVGIGQSIEKSKNKNLRFFAYSVLLNSSGEFLTMEQIADAKDKNEYIQQIGKKISEIINNHKNYKKIVFHIPEKISFDAIKEIENALKNVKQNIELYIIRVNDNSKFFGYANNNSLIPYESSFIQLSEKEFLLWTEGLNYDNPTPRKRYSNPIYIEFYYTNQEKIDFNSFLQDILNLTGTNYRGFNAKSVPVSMYYPKIISNFYKKFMLYNLNVQPIKRDKLWFL